MYRILLLALLFLPAPAFALDLAGSCEVRFAGSSTLHDFNGTGACDPFVLQIDEGRGEPALRPAALHVAVGGMQTGNGSRDEKMRGMFAADRFPRIVGTLAGGPIAALRRQTHAAAGSSGTLPLLLKVRDIELPVAAKVTRLVDTTGEFSLDLEFPVSLAAYRLEPPSVLGLIRVADGVLVQVSLRLAPLSTPWQP